MSRHTPGPWVYDDIYGLVVINKQEIAAIHVSDGRSSKANALLIAAAPEIYDALDAIASACALQSVSPLHAEEVFKMIGRTATTALAKVKGE